MGNSRGRKSQEGFSIIDLLVTMSIMGILASAAVPQLLMAFDRGRQRCTMGEMRNVASAVETYHLDQHTYPLGLGGLTALLPDYYQEVPISGWGTPFFYIEGGGCMYLLIDLGSDGAFGPNPSQDPWGENDYEPDMWHVNGVFLRAPGEPDNIEEIGSIAGNACS